MTDAAHEQWSELKRILANQRALGRRFLWLLLVPFVLTGVMLAMFIYTIGRVTDIEVVTSRLEIDRYLQLEGNLQWAVGRYAQLAKAHPSGSILARLGVLYFQASPANQEIAVATLEEAKRSYPENWEVYRSLTYLYAATNQTKNAIQAGKKALELDALDSGTYNNLAWCYTVSPENELRDLALAETYALKAIQLTHNRHAEYFDTLAQVYVAKGNRDQAVKNFRTAIRLARPGNVETYQNHLRQNYPDESL
jgi:tetratricopeptide (TPR) repeat protein